MKSNLDAYLRYGWYIRYTSLGSTKGQMSKGQIYGETLPQALLNYFNKFKSIKISLTEDSFELSHDKEFILFGVRKYAITIRILNKKWAHKPRKKIKITI